MTRSDEAALYGSAGIALAAAVIAAGAGAGSARVGAVGATLALAGVLVSWQTRGWGMVQRLAVGVAGGASAGAGLQALIGWEVSAGVSNIYRAMGDIGLNLALHMAVFAVGLSFLLLTRDALSFSLVPGLSMFGLAGGRASESLMIGCFLVFLLAALATAGQAMLLSGAAAEGRGGGFGGAPMGARRWRRAARWRRRHWATVGALTAVILLLAYVLFVPLVSYGTQYRWPLMMAPTSGGFASVSDPRRMPDSPEVYGVGRGPVTLGEAPVLTIVGGPVDLLRGEVYDVYTGRAWMRDAPEPRALWPRGGVVDLSGVVGARGGVPEERHRVRAEVDQKLVFHAPGQAQRLALGEGSPRMLFDGVRVDKYGCAWAPGTEFRRGDSYEVVSQRLEAGRSPVRSSAGMPRAAEDEAYLRIPLSSRRVADLARGVVGREESSAGKLGALIAYLQQNQAYSLDAPAVPAGQDVADWFLFRQKRGYCDMYATTLAVMARAVGIPSRFVVGYAGGEHDPELAGQVMRESDAHAWVEVWIPEYGGWVSADATPAGELPPIPPLHRALLRARFLVEDHPVGAAGAGLALLGAALFLGLGVRRLRRSSSRRPRQDEADPAATVAWAYWQLCRLLSRRAGRRQPWQTPLEYLAGVAAGGEGDAGSRRRGRGVPSMCLGPAAALTELFVRVRYGRRPAGVEASDVARRHLAEFRVALRRGAAAGPG